MSRLPAYRLRLLLFGGLALLLLVSTVSVAYSVYGLRVTHAREAVPLSARIVAVADVFYALTSRRPYKPAWPVDKELAFMHRQAGSHFDPVIVKALHDCRAEIHAVYDTYKHV